MISQSNGPSWNVPLGRRDGRVSLSSQVSNMPSPFDSVDAQRQKFAAKGLDDHDLVTLVGIYNIYLHIFFLLLCRHTLNSTYLGIYVQSVIIQSHQTVWCDHVIYLYPYTILSTFWAYKMEYVYAGAHTIGQTHCQFVSYRLYNFTKTGNSDPTISPSTLTQLQTLCPNKGDGSKNVALDADSEQSFDATFFKNIRDGNAVLESDQRLWGDEETQRIVKNYAGSIRGLLGFRFNYEFQKAMVKMSSIEVKTGTQGEIRKICSKVNQAY